MPKTETENGFTLIELLIVVAIISILASIALPAYNSYVRKSKAKAAAADLTSLAMNFENAYQKTLSYPTDTTTSTATTKSKMTNWQPSLDNTNFEYSITTATASTYELTATGQGSLSGCDLKLKHDNTRNATSTCGFTKW